MFPIRRSILSFFFSSQRRHTIWTGYWSSDVCSSDLGLSVRHDHGSQYMSDAFQKELEFLGAESSPAFVRAPEGNGCAERFIRTLKENLLWVRTFDTRSEERRVGKGCGWW